MDYISVKTIDGGVMKISKLVAGVTFIGPNQTMETTSEMLDTYMAAGGNALDLARKYGNAEGLAGQWCQLSGKRDQIHLITKGGFHQRLSHDELLSDFYTSLSELKTDIDIYLLHRDDLSRPVSEIMDTVHEIAMTGRVRAVGASNWTIDRILEANEYARKNGKTPFTISEIQWSYATCTPDMWKDPTLCCMNAHEYSKYLENDIPIISFSSQGRAMFTRLYNGTAKWGDFTSGNNTMECEENVKKFDKVKEYCDKNGANPTALCLAYLLCNKVNVAPIIGCNNVEELKDSLNGLDFKIDQATIDWMNDIR